MSGIRRAVGEDFIIGLAVNLHPEIDVSLSIEAMQEIIAWHDERQLMDYVTCGTGSYFDHTGIIPNVFFPDKLGAPYAEALKAVVRHARSRPRATSARRRTPTMSWPRARPTWCRSSAVRLPTRISPPRRGDGRPDDIRPCLSCNQMCWGRRYPRLLDLLPDQPLGRPRVRMGRRPLHARRERPKRCWSSAAASRVSRRRGWPPSAATR